jgi:hypothetical protein
MLVATHRALLLATLSATIGLAGCLADSMPGDQPPPPPPSGTEASLVSNPTSAFNYFVHQGLTKIQAAGIVGNLMQESGVSPTIEQYGGGPGRGIAQWSAGGRWDSTPSDNVASYASENGESRWTLNTQLGFIWYELTDVGYGFDSLQAATTIDAAVLAFQDDYEVCGACAESQRIASAEQILADNGGSTSGGGGSTGGGSTGGATCYSGTLGKNMPDNACVQSSYDNDWYQCDNGGWVDRWTDPDACDGVYPL